jgi:hypothetical protein
MTSARRGEFAYHRDRPCHWARQYHMRRMGRFWEIHNSTTSKFGAINYHTRYSKNDYEFAFFQTEVALRENYDDQLRTVGLLKPCEHISG